MPVIIGTSVLFLGMCAHTIFGCSSTSAAEVKTQSKEGVAAQPVETTEDCVINWKNRGFGSLLPAWIQKAQNGDYSLLRQQYPLADGFTIVMVCAKSTDLDFTENLASEYDAASKLPPSSGLKALDASWIQIHPAETKKLPDYYIAVQLYTAPAGQSAAGVLVINAD